MSEASTPPGPVRGFVLLVICISLCGCSGVRRLQPAPHPVFAHCLLDSADPDELARLERAIRPYYEIVSLPDIRLRDIRSTTMACRLSAHRGLFGSSTGIRIERFATGELMTYVKASSGFLWSGRSASVSKALTMLDSEAAEFSAKLHPQSE